MNPTVKRICTALTTATLAALAIIYLPPAVVTCALIVLVALVHLEFSMMVAKKYEIMTGWGVAAGVLFLCGIFAIPLLPYGGFRRICEGGFEAGLVLTFVAVWLRALFGSFKNPLVALGTTFLGFVYIPLMLTAFVALVATGGESCACCGCAPEAMPGWVKLLYVVAMVKVSDMGGFAFGRLIGRHKLCPSISPNKTWEGLGGSLFAGVIVSCSFLPLTHFTVVKAVALGLVAAVVGTLGDLVESRFKREVGVKDSATFMPAGLGGFLDMFDSLIFVPIVLRLFLP